MAAFVTKNIAVGMGIFGSATMDMIFKEIGIETKKGVQLSEQYNCWAEFGTVTQEFLLKLIDCSINDFFIELLMSEIGNKFCVAPVLEDGCCIPYIREHYL